MDVRGAALIVIDVQEGFDDPVWGRRNNPGAEACIARLLAAWRAARLPIFHIQHMSTSPVSPLRPGQPGNAIKRIAAPLPGEPVLRTTVNSAFIGTDLEARLRADHIESVVIVGLTTNHCVETSTRMAGNLGFRTWLVSDATATFDRTGPDGVRIPAEMLQVVTLANMHDEFAQVTTTDALLQAL